MCTGWADCAQAVAQGEEGKHGQGDNQHAEQKSEMKMKSKCTGHKYCTGRSSTLAWDTMHYFNMLIQYSHSLDFATTF